MSRPERLPFPATRVVKGVREELLSWGLKATWLEHHALDRGPEGAYIGATGLAARIGLSARTVEGHRDCLTRLGLLLKGKALNGATAPWFPILPADCIPIEGRPTPEQLVAYVRRLEAHLDRPSSDERSTRKPYGASGGPRGSDRTVDPLSTVRSAHSAPYGRAPTPSHPDRTVAAQSRHDTVRSAPGGMEVVGVVGENLLLQAGEAGGRASATDDTRPEEKRALPVGEGLDAVTLEAQRRWAEKRQRLGEGQRVESIVEPTIERPGEAEP